MSTPQGWYPDPQDPSSHRYWDGTTWTSHVAPRYAAPTWMKEPFRPATGLGVASIVLALVTTAVSVAQAFAAFPSMDRAREAVADYGTPDAYFTAYDALSLVRFPVLIAAYVVTCLWLWQVRKNAEALRPQNPHVRSRGWVWGGWVCPIVAAWFPYQIVRDVDRATADTWATSLRVIWWWVGWLTFTIASNVGSSLSGNESTYQALGFFATLSAAGAVLSGVLWVGIVRRIGRTQAAVAAG